ncbi:hypothetical protein IDVR_37510 [Intrasporangium sp. DVR]
MKVTGPATYRRGLDAATLAVRLTTYVVHRSQWGGCDLCGHYSPESLRSWRVVHGVGRVYVSHRLCPSCWARWSEGLRQVRALSPEDRAAILTASRAGNRDEVQRAAGQRRGECAAVWHERCGP